MTRSLIREKAIFWLAVALAIYASARLLPTLPGLSAVGQGVLGVVLAGVVLWVSEAMALGLIAFVVLVLLATVTGVGGADSFVGFASPVVFFLIGAVALGTAVESSGLAARIAALLVRRARGSPGGLYLQILTALPGLAFLLPSAITRNAVLIPACRDALVAMGIGKSDRSGRALMLALGVLNPLASSALLTGGITSMTASAMIGDFSWFRWFVLMAVPYYVLIVLGGIALRVIVGRFEAQRPMAGNAAPAAPFSRSETRTLAVLALVSVLWLTDSIHGLSPAIPALIGAILLVCPKIGVLGWKDFESRLSWGLVLTVGASLSLAQAMIQAGTADWLGKTFFMLVTSMTERPMALLAGLIVATTVVHIAITNLAACIALLVPITMTIGRDAGINPIVCALIVTIVVDSVILYPVQTASNLLAYESGYFGAADVGRLGFVMLALTTAVVLIIALPYWNLMGLQLIPR
jgi:solute carrier family 13 (sodium-dependent dicarboxylate transporter), member 2/3/5